MIKCRSCSSDSIFSIIPLGRLPLANALVSEPSLNGHPTYNLEVMLCENCGLAQLKDLIDPEDLFSDYVYFSSNSDTMLASASELVKRIVPTLNNDSLVIEIASNDGYLLKNYIQSEIQVLGIDPANNIAKVANQNGIHTLCDFFNESLALSLGKSGKMADIIHANNVMAHVPDIRDFIKGLKILLKDSGQAIIEVPYFLDLVGKLEFDTIYHEHVYYFSVLPLKAVFERHDLEIFDIEKIEMHGGSLRLFVGHLGKHEVQPIIQSMIEREGESGIYTHQTFQDFMSKIDDLKNNLISTLNRLKAQNLRIAAYGASAKGTTLLNYFGIGKDTIDFVVDRSVTKQGKFTPGTQLKILPPNKLIDEGISHALLLSWNFASEIIHQQQAFVNNGGKFILPLPHVEVVP